MKHRILVRMSGMDRRFIIERHRLYVENVVERVLAQLSGERIEKDADNMVVSLIRDCARDRGDVSIDCAVEISEDLQVLLEDARDRFVMSSAMVVYYDWEKSLRDWLGKEVSDYIGNYEAAKIIWKEGVNGVIDLLSCSGWNVRDKCYFRYIDACRLVANVFKHGEGNSLESLKKVYPEYIGGGFDRMAKYLTGGEWFDYTCLKYDAKDFFRLHEAIMSFWEDVPDILLLEG